MIPMKENSEILFGTENPLVRPREPFSRECCEFLDKFAKALREDGEARTFPDIMTFAFWIRKGNVEKLKKKAQNVAYSVGKGLVFHIAPSNVPINFAYTFAFGLLAGNSNIVKVSSKRFKQCEILCRILNEVTKAPQMHWVQEENLILLYDREDEQRTLDYSKMCDVRVIWGGDRTVEEIRKAPLPPRSTELTFADRYSFAIMSVEAVEKAPEEELQRLAEGFYNDTYLMDQNACSAPHLVFWLGEGQGEKAASVKEKFWDKVYQVSGKYDLAEVKVSEKYTMLCEAACNAEISGVSTYENYLYVANLTKLPEDITSLRGKFGFFYQYDLDKVEEILPYISKKVQTCSCYGVEKEWVAEQFMQGKVKGVDRITDIGHTLDMDIIWDGYNVICELSRQINIQ